MLCFLFRFCRRGTGEEIVSSTVATGVEKESGGTGFYIQRYLKHRSRLKSREYRSEEGESNG
jgi:hypothetical protein